MHRVTLLVIVIAFAALSLLAADPNEELLAAARKGDLAVVKQQVEKGAAIEAKTPYGQTPLYLAAMNGHEDVVRFLLDKGASVDVRDTFYKAPMLAFVLQREHYAVAKMLILKGTKTPDEDLQGVAGTGKADLVQALLDTSKPSQAALDKTYEAALQQKQTEVAAVLKKAGAHEPVPPVAVDLKVLESYAGNYKSGGLPIEIKVFVKDGSLYMQATGQSEFPLKPKSATVFEFPAAQIVVEFDSASSFTLKQGGQNYAFKKAVTQ
jgi:hypothetical protein